MSQWEARAWKDNVFLASNLFFYRGAFFSEDDEIRAIILQLLIYHRLLSLAVPSRAQGHSQVGPILFFIHSPAVAGGTTEAEISEDPSPFPLLPILVRAQAYQRFPALCEH